MAALNPLASAYVPPSGPAPAWAQGAQAANSPQTSSTSKQNQPGRDKRVSSAAEFPALGASNPPSAHAQQTPTCWSRPVQGTPSLPVLAADAPGPKSAQPGPPRSLMQLSNTTEESASLKASQRPVQSNQLRRNAPDTHADVKGKAKNNSQGKQSRPAQQAVAGNVSAAVSKPKAPVPAQNSAAADAPAAAVANALQPVTSSARTASAPHSKPPAPKQVSSTVGFDVRPVVIKVPSTCSVAPLSAVPVQGFKAAAPAAPAVTVSPFVAGPVSDGKGSVAKKVSPLTKALSAHDLQGLPLAAGGGSSGTAGNTSKPGPKPSPPLPKAATVSGLSMAVNSAGQHAMPTTSPLSIAHSALAPMAEARKGQLDTQSMLSGSPATAPIAIRTGAGPRKVLNMEEVDVIEEELRVAEQQRRATSVLSPRLSGAHDEANLDDCLEARSSGSLASRPSLSIKTTPSKSLDHMQQTGSNGHAACGATSSTADSAPAAHSDRGTAEAAGDAGMCAEGGSDDFGTTDSQHSANSEEATASLAAARDEQSLADAQLEMARDGPVSICPLSNTPKVRVGPEDFQMMKVVGQGAFGKVFQVRYKSDKRVYAMKVMRKEVIMQKDHGEYVKSERDLLTAIIHPYIVQLRFSFQTPSKLYLVLDFINGGHLFFNLYRQGVFGEDVARLYTAEIVSAIAYLHGRGIAHRDLKPENVLLDSEGHVKLTDFGLAKSLESSTRTNSFIGTMEYMAPEIVEGKGHGLTVDWWSVGVLVYEMLCGMPPFRAKNRQALQQQILIGKIKWPKFLSTDAQSLIKGLLNRDVSKRLGSGPEGAVTIKKHPFFKTINWAKLEKREIESKFRPAVTCELDVANFDKIWTEQSVLDSPCGTPGAAAAGLAHDFKGFTYVAPSFMHGGSFSKLSMAHHL